MTAAPTKPRALRRLSQLHDAKSLGRDKELARRLQKGAAEPSPQSYKETPGSPRRPVHRGGAAPGAQRRRRQVEPPTPFAADCARPREGKDRAWNP